MGDPRSAAQSVYPHLPSAEPATPATAARRCALSKLGAEAEAASAEASAVTRRSV
jgi:hypothetical protein